MKKIIVLVLFFMLLPLSFGANLVVQSLNSFESSKDGRQEFKGIVIEKTEINNSVTFEAGTIIHGQILRQVEAKRAKRNGYIIIRPTMFEIGDKKYKIKNDNLEAKVVSYSKPDWKSIGENAGLSAGLMAGSHFVPGLSQMFYFSKGFLKPEEDQSRLKAGLTSLYKNSPFVYIEKGQEFSIQEGDLVTLKFIVDDETHQDTGGAVIE